MRSSIALLTSLAAVALAGACTGSPRADVVPLTWTAPSAPSTTTATTRSSAAAPATPSTPAPTTPPRATAAPTWACRFAPGPDQDARRHAAFVRNAGGSGLPESSRRQVLAQLARVEANLPLYCAVETLTGVPALVLAAIHYREANNDPARSILSGEVLGTVNPDSHAVEGTAPLDNAVRAAEHLRGNAREIYGVVVDADMSAIEFAYAAAAYNRGGRYCRADQLHPMRSPYVAAGIADATVGMIWPDLGGAEGGPEAWGEPPSVRGRPDPRLGALTLLRGLGSEITAPGFAWNTAEVVIPCR